MSLKQILQLKDKKVVYVLEENDSTYTYRKQKVNNYTLTLVCRRRKCLKRFGIHQISKLTYLGSGTRIAQPHLFVGASWRRYERMMANEIGL